MKLSLKHIRVASLDSTRLHIVWDTCPYSIDLMDYTFEIWRSESQEGNYEVVAKGLEDTKGLTIIDEKLGNQFRNNFYKIITEHKSTGGRIEHGVLNHSPPPDLYAQEFRRNLDKHLKEFTGRTAWLLPVRTYGPRCPVCWDSILFARTTSGCITCFDTGFIRGYYRPIEIAVQVDPSPKNDQTADINRLQQQDTTARMNYYPVASVGDIIVEKENIRWVITSVASTQQNRSVVTQELQLHRIVHTDITYKIPIDLNKPITDIIATSERNYHNPQDMNTAAIAALKGVYNV